MPPPIAATASGAGSRRERPHPFPLPDFFIGAHAQLAGWPLATADPDRIRTYFPTSFFSRRPVEQCESRHGKLLALGR